MERQDRIDLHKTKRGIASGAPGRDELIEGVPIIRTVSDEATGQQKTIEYIKDGNNILSSEYRNTTTPSSSYSAQWHIGQDVSIADTGTTKSIFVRDGSYVMDIKILITTTFSGSYSINIGDDGDVDRFVSGWDETTPAVNTIISPGTTSTAPDAEGGIATGYLYTSANTIDVNVGTAGSSGAMRILALILKSPIISNWS